MKARQLWFTEPQHVEIREQELPALEPSQLLVESTCSAISAGTEMLVYRGQVPQGMALDATLAVLQHESTYPLQYGYACTGKVIKTGADIDDSWLNRRVFSFQPHASHFIATPEQLQIIPDDIDNQAAVFLANMETAVNLLLDSKPLFGERVVVMGLGIVGLLLSGLLARFPLSRLFALDGIADRRKRAKNMGVSLACDPASEKQVASLREHLQAQPCPGADLVYEVSGNPEALNLAIDLCGYTGRLVIGSWYGSKTAPVTLGGNAHRNRLSITTSQVSSIAPELGGRWDKARRFELAWEGIRQLQPQNMINHRLPLDKAGDIYKLLHLTPEKALQAVFVYDSQDQQYA